MKKALCFFLILSVFCCGSNAFSQDSIYMAAYDANGVKIDGGCKVAGHKLDIPMLSYSFGVSACGSTGCTTPSSMSDFSVMMALNPATMVFKSKVLKRTLLSKVDVTFRRGGASYDYYNIHMEDVLITSVQEAGSSEVPMVSFSLAPKKMAWRYTADNSSGGMGIRTKGGWDNSTQMEWSYY